MIQKTLQKISLDIQYRYYNRYGFLKNYRYVPKPEHKQPLTEEQKEFLETRMKAPKSSWVPYNMKHAEYEELAFRRRFLLKK